MYHFIPEEIQLFLPYLCEKQEECNGENFLEYPMRYGFNVDSIKARGNNFSAKELDDLAAFLQAWLVFGLIRKLLGPSEICVELNDFVFHDEGSLEDPEDSEQGIRDGNLNVVQGEVDSKELPLMVGTDRISLYILYWMAKECHIYDPDRRDQLWAQHAATFTMVNSVINKLIRWRKDFYPSKDEPQSWML